MTRLVAVALLACALSGADQKLSPEEQRDLDHALAEAGASPVEYLRALESHLAKYPDSPRRAELERAAARAAIEANDAKAIVRYGELALARLPDDAQILDQVTRALLEDGSRDASADALKHARHLEEVAAKMKSQEGVALALRYEARATGNLGDAAGALALAQKSFVRKPTAEAAREIARWYENLGQLEKAAIALADAFTIPSSHPDESARSRDRARMGELWIKAKGSEAGLGDVVLRAYDRNFALVREPSTDPMEFTLTGVDGQKLRMSSLKGKVVVLDFWATWCGPCRAQHPLFEQVKRQLEGNSNVVFLSIDNDEDRAAVKPFLDAEKWQDAVYFEDGLARALSVLSIPATIVIGKDGRVFSRLTGFSEADFAETLAARIRAAM
jgi:thiol-disulfide isomerase/thioredoxin